jgi:hypothetical protein
VRADALFAKFLQTQRDQRLLIATRDDLAAVYAKNAIEMNGQQSDCIIVSQGLDPIIDGGASEKKEIDPNAADDARPCRHPRSARPRFRRRVMGQHDFHCCANGRNTGSGMDEHCAQHPPGAAMGRDDLYLSIAAAAPRA